MNPLFPNITTLSWKDIFYYNPPVYGTIEKCYQLAKESGYPYFCWNNRVHHTESKLLTPIVYDPSTKFGHQFIYDYDFLKQTYCGRKVTKISGKPFRSDKHTNTVKDVVRSYRPNDTTDIPAFKFEEDDSLVHCYLTKIK